MYALIPREVARSDVGVTKNLQRISARASAWAEWIAVAAIILVAAWLRFYRIDQIEFLWDQAEISKWAIQLVREGRVLPIGPVSSTGIDSFPGAIWLLAIPYAISLSPVVATGFIAMLNVAAVVGTYLLGRRWFGRGAALVAAMLFAVAPWGVIYSRKIWHVEFFAPISILHAATGWLAFVRGKRWALLLHALVLAFFMQMHFSALAMALLTAVWGLVFIKRLDWRLVVVSIAIFALALVPYLVYDAGQGWRNVNRFAEMMRQPSSTDGDAARAVWALSTGADLSLLLGPDHYPQYVEQTSNVRWFFTVEGGLILAGVATALAIAGRQLGSRLRDGAAAGLMAVCWLAIPVLFQTRHSVPVAPHYFTATFPAQFLLVGLLVQQTGRLPTRVARWVQGVVVAAALLISAAQTVETVTLLDYVFDHDTRLGYGTPVKYSIQAAKTAVALGARVDAAEVILLAEGEDSRMYEMASVADTLLYGSLHRAVDVRNALVLPADPAVYWSTFDRTRGEELLAALVPEVAESRIPLRGEERSYRFYLWPGGPTDLSSWNSDLVPVSGERVVWETGAELVAYAAGGDPRPGGLLDWVLVWRVNQTSSYDMYFHWFNHLLAGNGQVAGQMDGPSYLPIYWRVGDTVVNWFQISISPQAEPGAFMMRVGMYTYPQIAPIPLDDGREWALLGPIEIGR